MSPEGTLFSVPACPASGPEPMPSEMLKIISPLSRW